jgi:hypothetical protein
MSTNRLAATAWDAEYSSGRYRGDPAVTFTHDILAAARSAGVARGLYIGCGNGRNYLPLVAGGLDLTGLDISAVAIAQLAARSPNRSGRMVCGDLASLPADASYPLVIGIQVFQHGDRTGAHAHIRAAQQQVTPGGLCCLRVNATATDIWPEHEVTERDPDGGLTVHYRPGPKHGLTGRADGWIRRPDVAGVAGRVQDRQHGIRPGRELVDPQRSGPHDRRQPGRAVAVRDPAEDLVGQPCDPHPCRLGVGHHLRCPLVAQQSRRDGEHLDVRACPTACQTGCRPCTTNADSRRLCLRSASSRTRLTSGLAALVINSAIAKRADSAGHH